MTQNTENQADSHEELLGKGAVCVVAHVRRRVKEALTLNAEMQGDGSPNPDNATRGVLEDYARRFAELGARAPTDEKAAWACGAAAAWASYTAIAITPAGEERDRRLRVACEPTGWNS